MARYFLGLQKQVPNHGAEDMILVQSTRYSRDRAEKIFPPRSLEIKAEEEDFFGLFVQLPAKALAMCENIYGQFLSHNHYADSLIF